jgi:hypothetical protein
MLHHEAAVASFNMSNNRPGIEGRPTKGFKATSHQTEPAEKTQMSPSGPRQICSEADRVISTFSFDSKPRATPIESPSRGGQWATWVSLWNDLSIYGDVG